MKGNLKQAPVPPSAWIQLGCQMCGMYFWQELKSGDRQRLFCNPCTPAQPDFMEPPGRNATAVITTDAVATKE